tara:strand:- start:170 stop:478 length:309 start_codon:yes stop_codon:yes gene_type:complete
MIKDKKIITVSGYFSCDMDVVVSNKENLDDAGITRRAELIMEAHMRTIGINGYAEFTTEAQQKRMNINSAKWNAEQKKEEKAKSKAYIKKAVARALSSKKRR